MLGTTGSLILLAVVLALVALDMAVLAFGAGRVKDRTVTAILIGTMVAGFTAIGVATVVAA